MALKNVVQVMNFHSLLRVDKSRRQAKKYSQMEAMVLDMLDNILNNRNIQLDLRAMQLDPKKPELQIYLGSDMGFCGNLNNLVRREKRTLDDEVIDVKNIIIGRKLSYVQDENTILYMTREEFNKSSEKVVELLKEAYVKKEYSSFRLIYNHYRNTSQVDFMDKVILPMPKELLNSDKNAYKEDFVAEGDMQDLLIGLVKLYLEYELEIASNVSVAAENINRQNITTESLKKIDEREEIRMQEERRAIKDKEFAKILDNFTKLKYY